MRTVDLVEFHSFLPAALPEQPIVLDLGANRGHFSQKMKERYGARCIAVEPVPTLYQTLLDKGIWECHHLAIFDRVGTISFNVSDRVLAGSIFPVKTGNVIDQIEVPCSDLKGLLETIDAKRIDLMKVDVEGAEIAMLQNCPSDILVTIPQITVEFHDFCGLVSSADVETCLARLARLGFVAIRFSRVGHQDTLLINRSLIEISPAELAWIRHVYRNAKGMTRLVRKAIYGRRWAKGYS